MKAVILTEYGSPDKLQISDIDKPIPRDNEVLIKTIVSTVTLGDCELRSLTLPLWTRIPMRLYIGFSKPGRFSPGMEISGLVEAVGKNVNSLKVGDAVFGSTGMSMGGNAEYKCRPANEMAIKPDNVTFEDVATIPVGGINALHFLRKADIKPGQKLLIIGAGGSIGTYGVQLGKLFGATVTAVDSSSKLDMLREIGADNVIDYTRENYLDNGSEYDVIFDVVYSSPFKKCINLLNEKGVYLMANTDPLRMIRGMFISRSSKKKAIFSLAAENVADLSYLADLIALGKIKPVIDRRFRLEDIREAHDYVEKGLKNGCVIVQVHSQT